MADTVKARVTNKAPGPRGIWAGGELVDIAPGKSRVLELTQDVIDDADKASFTIETGKAAEQGETSNNRLFLAAADSEDHANFRLIDLGAATHIGFATGDSAPILPAGYRWGPVSEAFAPAVDADDDLTEDAPQDAELLKAAVEGLDHTNDEHWTKAGAPAVDAVTVALGADVTRAQIDDVMPGYDRDKAKASAEASE